MNKKLAFSLFLLLSLSFNSLFAQFTANMDTIRFKPTNELQLDSSLCVVYNHSTEPIRIHEIKFFNTYSSTAFYVNPLSDSIIPAEDSLSFFVYFKPRHNIYHNSEMLIVTDPNCYSFSLDLRGQGEYSIPYYDTTKNLSEENLKAALKYAIARGYVSLGYDLARNNMFMTIDNQKTNGQGASVNTLECIYTGKKSLAYNTRTESQTNDNFNTEHTFPQGYFSSAEPMKSDLHHLFPTNDAANSSRSNYAFGIATTPYVNESANNPSHLGANTIYEPRDVQKGRTARAMMYFVLRYQDYTNFFAPQESILRKWNVDFPPTAVDRKRNADIQLVQKNRNPFVDYPQFAERITKLVSTSTQVPVKSIYFLDSIQSYTLSDTSDSVILHFPIVNTGNQSILISNGISTNNLVDFRFDSLRIAPGESTSLPIVIHTKDTTGTFTSGLEFYTDHSLIFLYSRLNFKINHVTTGVNTTKRNSIFVYPNPVNGEYLNINADYNHKSVMFYNIAGQMVLEQMVNNNKIDVSKLIAGFYTMKIENQFTKIIKQ